VDLLTQQVFWFKNGNVLTSAGTNYEGGAKLICAGHKISYVSGRSVIRTSLYASSTSFEISPQDVFR
jgi:hypothetical protein